MPDDVFEITLTTQVYGGECMGRLPDGRAVFVPFALPGELVRVRLVEEKRGHARAELVEVLQPSPQRIQPFCSHFGVCGGCHYQHLPYAGQLAVKQDIVRQQLERIGGVKNPNILPIVPSPQQTRYRNHVQFHLTAQGELGYHRAQSNEVLPLRECHLPLPAIDELWPLLSFEPGQSLKRIGVRAGLEDDLQLILESSDDLPPDLTIEELPISAVHLGPSDAVVLAGSPAMGMQVLDKTFQVSAGSFFQVNNAVAGAMVQHILQSIPQYQKLGPEATLIDIYCGVGLFSAFLAEKVGRVVGIEASPSACEDYAANLDAYDHIELYEAPAEIALPALDLRPELRTELSSDLMHEIRPEIRQDIALVDPPRAGLERRAMDGLIQLGAPLIVYISCDPATLARDVKKLAAAGYELMQVQPFDMFPHTYHVETVAWMTKG